MNFIKRIFRAAKKFFRPKTIAPLSLCAFTLTAALPALAQPASINTLAGAVEPRNMIMTLAGTNLQNGVLLVSSNASPATCGWYTNLLLSAAYQHDISVLTIVTPTNTITGDGGQGTNVQGSSSGTWTNYFDLGKIVATNSQPAVGNWNSWNGSGNTNPVPQYVTNWTTSHPITISGTFGGLTSPQIYNHEINHTNFDGWDLIKDSLIQSSPVAGNNYGFMVIIGQTQ